MEHITLAVQRRSAPASQRGRRAPMRKGDPMHPQAKAFEYHQIAIQMPGWQQRFKR